MFIRDNRNTLTELKNLVSGDVFIFKSLPNYYMRVNIDRTDCYISIVSLLDGKMDAFDENLEVKLVKGIFVLQNEEKIK